MSAQDVSLRQALAIAIVRNKRRCDQEAADWRSKSQKLEAELQQQQAKHDQLRQWVATVLQQSGCNSVLPAQPDQAVSQHTQMQLTTSMFLPPLSTGGGSGSHLQTAGSFQALQQQVALAAAAAGDAYSSVADVLDGKAAALSSMLLTNVQMLQQLSQKQPNTDRGGCNSEPAQGHAAESVASISSFITSTLLQAPRSSLSTAYMKQCAAVLAAMLSGSSSIHAVNGPADHAEDHQQQQPGPDSPESLAVQVMQLMQQLLDARAAAAAGALSSTCAGPETGSSCAGAAAAATSMLQQLSVLPSTALLLCLAAAQRMQQCVLELQEANSVIMRTSLDGFSTCAAAGEQALLVAGKAFQMSHELLADLEGAVLQVPVWGIALAECTWTSRALEDLVASTTSLYQSCADLQGQQPLLAGSICSLCANLATALQQLAANGDAPGMRTGLGTELRSIVGGLCVKLRDLFMPAEL